MMQYCSLHHVKTLLHDMNISLHDVKGELIFSIYCEKNNICHSQNVNAASLHIGKQQRN